MQIEHTFSSQRMSRHRRPAATGLRSEAGSGSGCWAANWPGRWHRPHRPRRPRRHRHRARAPEGGLHRCGLKQVRSRCRTDGHFDTLGRDGCPNICFFGLLHCCRQLRHIGGQAGTPPSVWCAARWLITTRSFGLVGEWTPAQGDLKGVRSVVRQHNEGRKK